MSPMVSAARDRATAGGPAQAGSTRRTFLRALGVAAAAGVGATTSGCGQGPSRIGFGIIPVEGADAGALSERYISLTLELAKHQPSLVDTWLGPEARRAGARIPAPVLRKDAAALAADMTRMLASEDWALARARPADTPETAQASAVTRVDYLAGQIRALDVAAGRLLGEGQSFAAEAQAALGHTQPPRDRSAFEATRQAISERLHGTGTLAERHATFRRALAVAPDRIEAAFRAAVGWCHEASRTWLPLPAGETLTTRGSDDSAWAAFSKPTGPFTSELWIARHGGADVAQVLQLAAHEGTPGHHAQHVLAFERLVEGLGWSERALYPAFGPHRLLAEGAAEAGASLLLPLDVRERVCAEVLLPIAGQRASFARDLVQIERLVASLDLEVAYVAMDYLDGTLGSADAAARLRDDALLLDPAGMVSFIEKQRSRVLAYPVGRRLVTEALGTGDERQRWSRLAAIASTLTLGAHQAGVSSVAGE